jgi:hypothetical protein
MSGKKSAMKKAAAAPKRGAASAPPPSAAAAAAAAVAGGKRGRSARTMGDIVKRCGDAPLADIVTWARNTSDRPFGAFDKDAVDPTDRAAVLAWCHEHISSDLFKNAAAIVGYANSVRLAASKSAAPGDDQKEGELAASESDDEEAPDKKRTKEFDRRLEEAVKAAKALAGPNAPSAGAPCDHCGDPRPPSVGAAATKYRCPGCNFVSGQPDTAPVNVLAAQQRAAEFANLSHEATSVSSISQGQSDINTPSSSPRLSPQDRELERLAEDGPPFARFADESPISGDEALLFMRDTFGGPQMAHPSKSLVKLIISGKLMHPGLAFPRTTAEEEALRQRDRHGAKVTIDGTGTLRTSAALTPYPISSSQQLMMAFLSNIGPALFDRPRALLDWFGLLRSTLALEQARGWDSAWMYLTGVLADRVPLRKSFGAFEERMMLQQLFSMPLRPPQPPPFAYGGAMPAPRAPEAPRTTGQPWWDDCTLNSCRNWNVGDCQVQGCKFDHVCCWRTCSNSADRHRGRDCPCKPANFPTRHAPRGTGGKQAGRRAPPGRTH